jgi:hypothetical protein
MQPAKLLFGIVIPLLFVMIETSSAKVKSSVFHSMQLSKVAVTSKTVQALEERLRPYLERRISRSPETGQNRLNESDLFLLAKVWNSLSTDFKQLYLQATQIPSQDSFYVSPSGHFEVYYTTRGEDRVSPADNYGFGTSGNWRTKNSQPNGVPDYVDEIAWDLDSAWSMEIGRFQYIQPIPYKDATHASDRFKVVIGSLGAGFYGETFPGERVGTHGISCYIEINNDWSGPDWGSTGYDTIPYNGARVTCPHEFFHTIQYAMAWSQFQDDAAPDSFPLSWTEGTAVMMEGLAFRYVYDYIQYTPDYFDDPTMTMLDPTDESLAIYANSLMTKFLHELHSPAQDNDFIRHIFFSNYDTLSNFYKMLRAESSAVGANWVDILNAYHTQSYFTGARAVNGIFIQDAPLLPEWSFSYDALDAAQKSTKRINLYAMQVFAFQPSQIHGDTLEVNFQGDAPAASVTYPTWSASCILERPNGRDSIARFSFANNSSASLEIPSWNTLKDALFIVSNGDIAASHNATISFVTCPVTYAAGSQDTVRSATASDTAALTLKALTDLRCSLAVAVDTSNSMVAAAAAHQLSPVSSLFDIFFPATWSSGASIGLAISGPARDTSAVSTLGLYVWIDSAWSKVNNQTVSSVNKSLYAAAPIVQSGIYGVFHSTASWLDSMTTVAVFPNPARLKANGSIAFRGKSLTDLWIYSMDGLLLSHDAKGQNSQPRSIAETADGFDWQLRSNSGSAVSPGIYFALIGYKNPITGTAKKQTQKVFVIP